MNFQADMESDTMTGMTQDGGHKEYTVRDTERRVVFTGALLGESSSARPGKSRWFEVQIFKTAAGSYIVAGVGRTIVNGEVDRPWVQVCDDPTGVIEKLSMFDDEGTKYIPYTSKIALEQARAQDAPLDEAFCAEVRID